MKRLPLIPESLGIVYQRQENLLYFDFVYQPGDASSEELREWFEFHDVNYFVAQWGPEGSIEYGGVDFKDKPELATLFKLRFV